MTDVTTWLMLCAVGMALGTLVLLAGMRLVPAANRRRYGILVAVPLIAVVAYGLMSQDISAIETARGESVFALRYVDWLLTTPLHVLYLGLLAGATMGVIARAIGLMAATIVLGFLGAILAPPLKWLLFIAGSVAFLGVVYYAFYDFDESAQAGDDTTLALYRKLRAFVVVLWLIYPVIWMVAPVGFGFMNLETTALVVSYIDVVAKVGFGLIALSGQLSITDTTESAATPAD
jgi:sensory rhodopsin